jgi:aminopeptidase N
MPVAEITRAETRERADLLRVHSYTVALDFTRGDKVFGSESVITFDCARPGAASYADLVAEAVHEITLNGEPLDPAAAWADGRISLPALAASNELRVVADCGYAADGTALHRSVDSSDGKVYTYTKFEPAAARRVFANFEQPDLKAEFTFHITAPEHWRVLSNQPAPEPAPAEGNPGAAIWRFPATPRISTYLTAIAAGEYHEVRSEHTTPSGQVIPIGIACRASLAEFLEAEDMFTTTRQGLDFYTALFQTPYPFAAYDQVFVPEFSSGAMEQPGCVTFTERLLFRSKVTETMYELRADVILHEMAHMWFGDLVTMRWFDDLWLNESFADFCAALSSSEATKYTDAWATFSASRKSWGYQQDQLPSTHPVAADVPTITAATANFDGISYAKGASVLRQLAAYVGREPFFAGIRSYLAEHAWQNATLTDLLAALTAASGKDLAGWSKVWLETAGPNTLRAKFEIAGNDKISAFDVLQEAPAAHPTLRPHHIGIGLYSQHGGALTCSYRTEVEVTGAVTAVPGLIGQPQPDLILLNDGDLGYALVRFDERSLRTLSSSIGELADPLARAVCWTALMDMTEQAELALPAFYRLLARGMGSESSVAMLQVLLDKAQFLAETIGDPAWVPDGKAELAAAALPLLRAAGPGTDRQLAWTQLLSWAASTDEQLDLLAGLLDGTESLPGLVVDTELRWSLLRRLASAGRAGEAEIAAELDRDATDAGQRSADGCRAAIPDAAHKAAAWRLLTEQTDLGMDRLIEVIRGFNQAEHAALLAPYAERYFEALPRIWATRPQQLAMSLSRLLFPYSAASAELIQRIGQCLASTDNPGMQRTLIERRDVVERALRSRQLAG